jgi:hypothetical protein
MSGPRLKDCFNENLHAIDENDKAVVEPVAIAVPWAALFLLADLIAMLINQPFDRLLCLVVLKILGHPLSRNLLPFETVGESG